MVDTYISAISMVMPVPNRSKNHVASPHRHSLAMDGSEPTLSLNDEAHSEGDMSVGRCGFIGHNELQAAVDGIGRVRCLITSWVDKHEDPTLGLFLCDQFASAEKIWSDILVAPDVRQTLGVWFGGIQFSHLCP